MAYDEGVLSRDAIASAAIRTNRICKQGASDQVTEANANDAPIGISPDGIHDQDSANAADAGDQFRLAYAGFKKLTAGGAITAGAYIKSDADGKGVVISTTPGAAAQNYIGIARTAVSGTGITFTCQIMPGVRAFTT